jgi:hypothetical protein
MTERDKILKALRDAKAPWQSDGLGVRGTPIKHGTPLAVSPDGRYPLRVESTSFQPSFPEASNTVETAATDDSGSSNANEYSFELEVDSIDNGDTPSVDIHVGYGEINDTPPTGMTGADDYVLTISIDGTEIWAVITYDTSTLAIISRALAFGASVPASTFGTLYVGIGFVDIAFNGDGKITEVNPHNRQCGDINFDLITGELNGAPALYPIAILSNAVPIP